MGVLEYKCPCCGATLKFDSGVQKMKCEYCDNEFDMDLLKKYEESLNTEDSIQKDLGNYDRNSGNGDWTTDEASGMRVYSCPSCGGEIFGDDTMGATKCPYCDSATVIQSQFEGILRPDYVIPFVKSKDDAKQAFKKNCWHKRLLPDNFITENRMEEIKGVYVPFWLYDCNMNADINFKAEKRRHWAAGGYSYTETSHYMLKRKGDVNFVKVPADGSSKMEDVLMESIEPFDYEAIVDFQTAYLSGYMADKYDVDAKTNEPRANERMENSIVKMFRESTSAYSSVMISNKILNINSSAISYALMPVWILNTKYKEKIYTFAMNGQTGKFVGELPIDKKKVKKYFFMISLPIAIILSAVLYFV